MNAQETKPFSVTFQIPRHKVTVQVASVHECRKAWQAFKENLTRKGVGRKKQRVFVSYNGQGKPLGFNDWITDLYNYL